MDQRTSSLEPAKPVPANSNNRPSESAPPAVSGNPDSDTHGATGTSTSEGPPPSKRRPNDFDGDEEQLHPHRNKKVDAGVSPPGERVDDEHDGHGDKTLKRQE